MRKVFSIVFTALLLLNVMGYYGVFLGLQYKNDRDMVAKFDREDYSADETIIIKVPVSIPYAMDNEDFVRVDGKFEHKGEVYRLVKQKLASDTLYVVCIPDPENKRIEEALTSYVKTFTDSHDQHSGATVLVSFIKDYIPQTFSLQHKAEGWEIEVIKQTPCLELIPSFTASIIHPPERG